MAKRSGDHRSNWWTEKTNGIVNWLAVAISGLAVVAIAVGVGVYQQRIQALTSAQTAPARTALPSETPTEAPATRVAFLGDSYTDGVGADSKGSWAVQVAAANEWDADMFAVRGSGYVADGDNDAGSYVDRVQAVIDAKPSIVVISGGRNDMNEDQDLIEPEAGRLFDALQAGLPEATIVTVLPWWGAEAAPARFAAISDTVGNAAEERGIRVIDTGQPLLGHSEWMLEDGVHPNGSGHTALASAFLPAYAG